MKKYDVAIIGAGPAGIMASIIASRNGKRVVLIEKNHQVGRKLLSTGNGRCNLTNRNITMDRYHGATPAFIETVISQFDQYATMEFFQNLGLVLKEEDNGRIFPRTNQASSVVEILQQSLSRSNVDVLLESQVTGIERSAAWKISLANGRQVVSDQLIIATGGRAAHQLGSTGDGLYWSKKLGHSLTAIYAALVPIETVEQWPKDIQGVKVDARVWATSNNKKISEGAGDLLFTSYGVSGPAVMAQAGNIAPLLKTSQVVLHIDLFPDMTEGQLDQIVLHILQNSGKTTVKDSLVGLLPNSMITLILKFSGIGELKQAGAIPERKRLDIVRILKDITLTVSKLRPLKEAQVTSGGLNAEEINARSLQSKIVKGLYFAGEIIDVDGDSGGFNLQWAWSSGYVAGMLAK
ncbi:MAG: NAD(P)/FAD-dependent oxidoreductase [Armatimonadota bacterium]|nr:NAD(P)/FAD-dependent oxidoreductase [bacterium]